MPYDRTQPFFRFYHPVLLVLWYIPLTIYPQERNTPPHIPMIGNFAHNQTPSTVFGFGQNIYPAHTWLFYPIFVQAGGNHSSIITLTPGLIYALTDSFSLYAMLPIVAKQKITDCLQRGVESFTVQAEYAFYNASDDTAQTMLTCVGNIGLPTTHLSTDYSPTCTANLTSYPTNFFIGATASRLSIKWYCYCSLGTTINVSTKEQQVPRYFVAYQWGIGRNLGNWGGLTTLASIEFNGTYAQASESQSILHHHSGGNIVYIGPTFFVSSDRWFISGGIQGAVIQPDRKAPGNMHYELLLQSGISF